MPAISQEHVIKSEVLQLVKTDGPTESTMRALKLQCNGTPRGGGFPLFLLHHCLQGEQESFRTMPHNIHFQDRGMYLFIGRGI